MGSYSSSPAPHRGPQQPQCPRAEAEVAPSVEMNPIAVAMKMSLPLLHHNEVFFLPSTLGQEAAEARLGRPPINRRFTGLK